MWLSRPISASTPASKTAVLIHGAITHIELWAPDEWAVRGVPGDAELADPAGTDCGIRWLDAGKSELSHSGPNRRVTLEPMPPGLTRIRSAHAQPLDWQGGSPLLRPLPLGRSGRNPDGRLVEGLRMGWLREHAVGW